MAHVVLSAIAVGATITLAVTVTRQPVSHSANTAPAMETPATSTTISMAASSTLAEATPSPARSPDAASNVRTAVQKDVPGAEVAVEVYDRKAGTVVASLDADRQFSAMSLVKLLIALDVLHQNNLELPDKATQNELTRMLSASDDNLASLLWTQNGGRAIVEREADRLGLTNTHPPDDPGEWGDTTTTTQDMVTVYRYIMDTLPDADRTLLYNAMYHAPETAADGNDQYFGIPDGLPGTTWAIKQGWGSSGSTAFFHTTGLVGADSRYVVVVLTSADLSSYRRLGSALTSGTAKLADLLSSG